jgi:secreted trypsin-like serine protease
MESKFYTTHANPTSQNCRFKGNSMIQILVLLMVSYSHAIINGITISAKNSPWQVSIRESGDQRVPKHYCGGSIISPKFVLTAAHCVKSNEAFAAKISVYGGGDGTLRSHTLLGVVRRVHLHPLYKTKGTDLAVLELGTPMTFNDDVAAIELPFRFQSFDQLTQTFPDFFTSGWGATEDGRKQNSEQLKFTGLTMLPQHNESFWDKVTLEKYFSEQMMASFLTGQFYAIDQNVSGPCRGDSGGPLVASRRGVSTSILTGVVNVGTSLDCVNERRSVLFADVIGERQWLQRFAQQRR